MNPVRDRMGDSLDDELAEDMSNVPKAQLENKDMELRSLYRTIAWRMFPVKRLVGRISISVETKEKGFRTSDSWYRRITLENVTEDEVQSITDLIDENRFSLAVNEVRQEQNLLWTVEIF